MFLIYFCCLLYFAQAVDVQNVPRGQRWTEGGERESSNSHRRLFGIRRLRMLHPVYEAPAGASDSLAVQSRILRRQQPRVVAPPQRFQFAAPRAQMPPVYLTAPHHHATHQVRELPVDTNPEQSETRRKLFPNEFDDQRIKRMQARWKKLGINLDTINFNYKQQHKATEAPEMRKSASSERGDLNWGPNDRFVPSVPSKYSTKSSERSRHPLETKSQVNETPRAVMPNIKQSNGRRPRINGPLLRSIDEGNTEETNGGSTSDQQTIEEPESFGSGTAFGGGSAVAPPFGGGFGSGNAFGGGSAAAPPFGGGFGSKGKMPSSFPIANQVIDETPEEPEKIEEEGGEEGKETDDEEEVTDPDEEGEEEVEPDQPFSSQNTINTESSTSFPPRNAQPSAYHSRTTPIYRHFQFTQKLAQRPRLHVRKPGEPRVEGLRSTNVEDLPGLSPYMNNARQKYGYDKPPAQQISQQPYYGNGQQSVHPPSIPPPPMVTSRPPAPPSVQPDSDFDSGLPSETAVPEESGVGFGDAGGAAFAAPSELPPELANVGFGVMSSNGVELGIPPEGPKKEKKTPPKRPRQRKPPTPPVDKDEGEFVIPENSGLRPVAPPKEFFDGSVGSFGSGMGGSPSSFGGFGGGSGALGGSGRPKPKTPKAMRGRPQPVVPHGDDSGSDMFTGDSALMRSKGPSGDGYGPSVPDGEAVPPMVPSVSRGGAAAGIPPPEFQEFQQPRRPFFETTENPPTTVRPSALLNVLNRADQGFNQVITHFERGSPVETAAIDILEVALGSQKLDSQAKLLGHVDRALGLDNLQRLQRWANTAGALDMLKEQVVKIAKNYQPPEDLLPTIPPQLEYLFKPTGR